MNQLGEVSAAGLPGLVGASASVEDFRKVSGVAAIKAATSQLNARLAAQGVPLTAALLQELTLCLVYESASTVKSASTSPMLK